MMFKLEVLQAISDWQRGGDAKQNLRRGQKLKEACAELPERYRTCEQDCFRQIGLPKGGVWDLIGLDRLPEKISSWTLDVDVAKGFKGGVPPKGQGYQGTILRLRPPPASVIVNLHELYRDPDFTTALEQNRGAISGYGNGAGLYGRTQSEVVLEIATITQDDIYSLSEHSTPFKQLVAYVANAVWGRATSTKRLKAMARVLELKSGSAKAKAGPQWLSQERTREVLSRVRPQAERLVEVKKSQDATKDKP